nr:putative ribonuclease H-like domain-containing protein [Tanacetum cinerariifolium]
MYNVDKKQEPNIKKAKSVLSSIGLRVASSVRRPLNRDSQVKNSVLSDIKKSSKKVEVSVRTNKKTDVASENVVSNKKIVTDVDVKNALKAKDLLCVSCSKNVLIPCHDKCHANYELNVHLKFRRALFTTPRTVKSKFEDTTLVVLKTRFSIRTTQSKSLDTTLVVSKTKIDVVTPLSANNKVSSAFKTITIILQESSLSKYMKNKFKPVKYGKSGTNYNQMLIGRLLRRLRILSHLNFGTINDLTKHDLVDGLSKFKYSKDHLCSICERGKSKKSSHQPKLVPSTHSKLKLLHMDLCGPMRAATINEKKYILVIVDDYSRFTWAYFLHIKDETTEIIKRFNAQVQLKYNAKIHKIRTDNDTEFKNATRKAHLEKLGIMQQFSTARTPQQIGVIERRNRTLVEAARTMHILPITIISLGQGNFHRLLHLKSIMETILVKFDELMAMASEHDSLEPVLQRFINDDSSVKSMNTPSKEDLDNLFRPMYKEYFDKRCSKVSINSNAQQVHNHEDSPLTSSIIVEEHEAPPILTKSKEQTSPILMNEADELNQEDSIEFDGDTLLTPYDAPYFDEAELSTTTLDPSNMHKFRQNKNDAENIVIQNKSRVVAKGYKGLMYLTASRPDIAFATFVCARYQARPTVKHLKDVKRIFRIFQLPQATNNNHEHFVAAPKFLEMVSFFVNDLGFTLELISPSNFKTTGLTQPWQKLGKMFTQCLTTHYVELLWEGLHYSLEHLSNPRFTKLIVGYYMTAYPEISRRVHDKYHNLEHDEMIKSIFSSGKNKAGVRIKIPSWMITDEMKLTENYQMYAEAFGVDVLMTQSQLIESTQGTHRTPSAARTPNPNVNEGESNTIQLSIAEQKSRDDLEAHQYVEKVKEHLVAEEIEKIVEGTESEDAYEVDNSILNSQNDPDTRLDPRSYKESSKVEKTTVVQPVNVIEEEDKSAQDDYELRRMVKGKNVEESRNTPSSSPIRSPRIHYTLISSDTEKLYELTDTCSNICCRGVNNDIPIWLALNIMFEGLNTSNTPCRSFAIRPRDQDDPHDDAHPEGEYSAKRQKISEHGTYVFGESSRGHANESEPDDDELPSEKVSQELVEEMSQTIDEAKLRKVINEIKEILVSPFPQKPTLVVQSYQRDPKDPALSLVNQDLLSLKKGKPIEEVYSNSKIVQVIKTYGELGHEHKFVTKIIVRRANGSIVSITEPDTNNLNKNDIEDMYLLCINDKVWKAINKRSTLVHQQLLSLVLRSIRCSPSSLNQYMASYTRTTRNKRVMRHQEIHKFCGATLKIVFEGLKSYNNDVKLGYVTPSLSKEDVEYLPLFKEEIEERLKHRDQMRR